MPAAACDIRHCGRSRTCWPSYGTGYWTGELGKLVPEAVPSGNPALTFEFDPRRKAAPIGADQ
jgi:hypothetical protein